MKKLTFKQEREIKIIEWFIPSHNDWKGSHTDAFIGLDKVIEETEDGANAIEAFFMKSERGKLPEKIRDIPRLRSLLWGKVWRERHLSELWDKTDWSILPADFLNEPDDVREFVFTKFFNIPARRPNDDI